MSINLDHRSLQELLGAYAVNAVDPQERAMIDEHLRTCDSCQRELRALLETSALLGTIPSLPHEALWERISSQLDERPQPAMPRLAPVTRSGSWHTRATTRLLATAAALVVVAGGIAVVQRSVDDDVDTREQLALQSADTAGARTILLSSSDASMNAKAVLLPDGRGFILDNNLPELEEGRTYQLWAVMGQTAVSAGVLGTDPSFVPFMAAGDVTALVITEEASGGVIASQNRPMLSAAVQPA